MGQGQEIIARKYMATAAQEGQWVLLQNTHLGLSYLTEVETYLTKEADAIHEDFRLWITAEPHPAFPIGLLQMGIKITNEAPVGIKAGLRASFQWVSQDMLDAVSRFEWRQLLFIQCYIHSIVQERRKFGPIGWNIPYEFNASDLSACTQFLQNHTLEMEAKKAPEPNWSTVRYMVSQIQYGGKITDDFDMLLMDTYVEKVRACMGPGFHMCLFEEDSMGRALSSTGDTATLAGTMASYTVTLASSRNTTGNLEAGTLYKQTRKLVGILDADCTGEGGWGIASVFWYPEQITSSRVVAGDQPEKCRAVLKWLCWVQFFHSAAMKVNYELYRDERSGQPYNVPEGNDIDVFRGYIETLAAQESPEIFGLHPNADLTFRTLQVRLQPLPYESSGP